MSFEQAKPVDVYKSLKLTFDNEAAPFCLGMVSFFWGRLQTSDVVATTVAPTMRDLFVNAAWQLLDHPISSEIDRLAQSAEKNAVQVGEEGSLLLTGYWSSVSYWFRYTSKFDPVWAGYAADVFLTGLVDYDDTVSGVFAAEMLNLSKAYSWAMRIDKSSLSTDLAALFSWSLTSQLGKSLA